MENPKKTLKLKLVIDKESNKVLYGEARKYFVDLIFGLLALPLGAFTKLLTKDAVVGSLGEVYDSLSRIHATDILPYGRRSVLLDPPLASTTSFPSTNFLLNPSTYQDTKDRRLYICSFFQNSSYSFCCPYVSLVKGITCFSCGVPKNTELQFAVPKSDASTVVAVGSDEKDNVEGVVTYFVMDDLTVVPMSSISSIALLNKLQIKDLGSLEEKTVSIGFEVGLKLLKASLETKTVLTDIYLKGNRAANA
ncbi:hypothetical protein FCM35_KLT18054 [Carex littledalei]|uniref:DUF674 domain-containing protein n=1 Tax=Carex littledalei TaxID=544730 RepID=A0A833VFB4_9POAL|nr:hypothetical protein FCM35_KLT18054 [Carex littledalei]